MTNSATLNHTIFLEDNLPVLRRLDSDSIDPIATDPPFNKGVGAFEGTKTAGDDLESKDVRHWGDVHMDWTTPIFKDHPRLFNVIRYANDAAREVIRERLQGEASASMVWNEIVRTPTEAPERTDSGNPVAPELVIVGRKRNARRRTLREVREQSIVSDGQRCQRCGWEPPYTDYLQMDHKRPRSLGGRDVMDNITLLCDPCNRKKSNKLTLHQLREARASEGRMDADWYEEEKWK